MDNFELDNKIKEKLQKDQIISNKANIVFDNFFKGGILMKEMEKEPLQKNLENKPKKIKQWKKVLTIAACLVVCLGGGQIYASTQGYGNIFFLIKYLVTGQKTEDVKGKENILSDRDITISYEPIQLTENIKIQIRNLQIRDNKARLFIAVNENSLENDTEIVPLTYKAYNSKNELICEQRSARQNSINYEEELILSKFEQTEKNIKLEVYKANKEKLSTLNIDLTTREISVEGEEEALKKISEIELKKFLSYISVFDPVINSNQSNSEDFKIILAECIFSEMNNKKENSNYTLNEINNMIESLGYEKISEDYKGVLYKINKSKGVATVETVYGTDIGPADIINIEDIKYSANLYTVKFSYIVFGQDDDTFEKDYKLPKATEGTLCFKLNTNTTYSIFKVVKYEEIKNEQTNEDDNTASDKEKDALSTDNNINTNDSNITKTENKFMSKEMEKKFLDKLKEIFKTVNRDKEKYDGYLEVEFRKYENNSCVENIEVKTEVLESLIEKIEPKIDNIDNSTSYAEWCNRKIDYNKEKYTMMFYYNKSQITIFCGYTDNPNQIVIPLYNNEKKTTEIFKINLNINAKVIFDDFMNNKDSIKTEEVSNSLEDIKWKQHIATGIKLECPENFKLTKYTTEYNPSIAKFSDKSIELEGTVVGKSESTNRTITSKMKITVYQPVWEEYIGSTTQNEYAYRTASGLLSINNNQIKLDKKEYLKNKKGIDFKYSEIYKDYKTYRLITYWQQGDSKGGFGHRILIELSNDVSVKVDRIIEYIYNSLDFTSF